MQRTFTNTLPQPKRGRKRFYRHRGAGYVFNSIQTCLSVGPVIAADAYGEGQCRRSQEAPMDRFFSRKHRRYLQILTDPRDELQRRIVLKLLAEEEATLREAPSDNKPPHQEAA